VRAQTAEVLPLRSGSPWQGKVVEDKDALDDVDNMKEADNGKLDMTFSTTMLKVLLQRVILLVVCACTHQLCLPG
jgi:hypothetical protein